MAHIATPRHPLRSHSTASGVYRPPPNGRPASARLPVRPSPRETAKQPLYRRLLFPRDDPDRPVRRIVQGKGDDIDEVNERLYTFIAYTLRAYVQSWFIRISPHDRTFIPHVSRLIVTFITPIIARMDEPQLLPLLLLHFPAILAHHVKLFRIAEAHVGTSLVPQEHNQHDLGHIYHSLAPIIACTAPAPNNTIPTVDISSPSPDSHASSASSTSPPAHQVTPPSYEISPVYLQQLVTALMRLYLPPEDFASDTERIVVREIVSNVVLSAIFKRISHGWFWWKVALALLGDPEESIMPQPDRRWIDWVIIIWAVMRTAFGKHISGILDMSSNFQGPMQPAPKQYRHVVRPSLGLVRELFQPEQHFTTRVTFALLDACETLLAPVLDLRLPTTIGANVFNTQTGLKVVEKLTDIVFPNDGHPGPTPVDPTPAEAADLRDRLERRIHQLLPAPVRYLMLGPRIDEQHHKIQEMLDAFSDTACNAHLLAMLLQAVVLALVPELEVGGPAA